MDDSSAVIDFPAVLIKIAPVINRAKEPRPCADRIVPMESGVIPEACEGVVTPATIVCMGLIIVRLVRLVMRLMVVVVIIVTIDAKKVTNTIGEGGCALACVVVGGVVGRGEGVGVRVVGMGRVGILGEMMSRVRRMVVYRMGRLGGMAVCGVGGRVRRARWTAMMMARLLEENEMRRRERDERRTL